MSHREEGIRTRFLFFFLLFFFNWSRTIPSSCLGCNPKGRNPAVPGRGSWCFGCQRISSNSVLRKANLNSFGCVIIAFADQVGVLGLDQELKLEENKRSFKCKVPTCFYESAQEVRSYCGWSKSILHHFEPMVPTIAWVFTLVNRIRNHCF